MKSIFVLSAVITALIFTANSALAENRTLRFRSGTVLAAELSTKPIKVANRSKYEKKTRFADVAYAQVVVKLNRGRSLSIYDFALVGPNFKVYKCMGVAAGDDSYDANIWKFEKTDPEKLYKLLFKVQLPGYGKPSDYALEYKLFKTKIPDLTINFRKMGNQPFTKLSEIPKEGTLWLSAKGLKALLDKNKKPAAAPAKPKETPAKPKEATKK